MPKEIQKRRKVFFNPIFNFFYGNVDFIEPTFIHFIVVPDTYQGCIMRKYFLFLSFSCIVFFTSCYNTRFIDYRVELRDPKSKQIAQVNPSDFSVAYPGFNVNYNMPESACVIENTSDSILYINLAQTWINGEKMYVNQVVTKSTLESNTTGTNGIVNLGKVAAGLGAGNAITTMASGVNVGGGNSNTNEVVTTTTSTPDQYVIIPPRGIGVIPCKNAIPESSHFLKGSFYDNVGLTTADLSVSYTFDQSMNNFNAFHHAIVVSQEQILHGSNAYNSQTFARKNRDRVLINNSSYYWELFGWCCCGIGVIGGVIIALCF